MSTTQETGAKSVLVFFTPKELEKMARREYQDPPLKKTCGEHPRWYIRVRKRVIGGSGVTRKQTREYLGFLEDLSFRDAQRARTAKLAEINGQVYSIPSHILLYEFFLIYNERFLPTYRNSTRQKYRLHFTNHISPEFGTWRMSDITTGDIQDFLNRKKASGLSWWTRNDIRQVLLSLFTVAEDYGYWKEKNPVLKARLPKEASKRQLDKKKLTPSQIRTLIEELPKVPAMIVRLIDTTGMRISEVLALRWDQIDVETGWLKVSASYYRGEFGPPKTTKSHRDLAMGELAADLRAEYLSQGRPDTAELVFKNESGGPLDYSNLSHRFLVPVAKRVGIYFEGFGWHHFRREYVSGMQAVGASSIEAAKMAGHSNTAMTQHYTLDDKDRQELLVKKHQLRLVPPVKSKSA